jgi:hypothetical protein
MPPARIHIDGALPAAEALARAQALLVGVSAARPVLLYGAELSGAAVALGAYQHAPHALRAHALALPALRRASGGAAVWASEGVLYFALGLADASALMTCPKGKLLNRNVRGFLAGVRGLGIPAHYFGRDFVSVGHAHEPGAYVGWYHEPDGRALLEFFVGLDAPFALPDGLSGYPDPAEPPLRGKRPTALRAAGAGAIDAAAALQRIAEGYARGFALELAPEAPSADELARATALRAGLHVAIDDDGGLVWSDPHEEAIGFVGAGARLDAHGRFAALRVGGDFLQRADCPEQLQVQLLGAHATDERIGAALDAVYAAEAGAIEGVRRLTTLQAALLQAAQRASSS